VGQQVDTNGLRAAGRVRGFQAMAGAAVMTVEQINATKDAIMEVILFLVCVGGIGFLWLASMGVFDKDN
jgi:putative lipase involved disintegration of autophagic bodies